MLNLLFVSGLCDHENTFRRTPMLILLRRSQFLCFLLICVCVITPIISVSHALSVQEKFSLTSPRLIHNQLTLKVDEEVEIAIAITDASLGSDIKQVKHPD